MKVMKSTVAAGTIWIEPNVVDRVASGRRIMLTDSDGIDRIGLVSAADLLRLELLDGSRSSRTRRMANDEN